MNSSKCCSSAAPWRCCCRNWTGVLPSGQRCSARRGCRAEPNVRFAALLCDAAPQAITALSERLRVPNDYRELALLTARLWQRIATADALDGGGVLELLEAADAFRRPDRFELLLRATQARSGSDDSLHAALAVALADRRRRDAAARADRAAQGHRDRRRLSGRTHRAPAAASKRAAQILIPGSRAAALPHRAPAP